MYRALHIAIVILFFLGFGWVILGALYTDAHKEVGGDDQTIKTEQKTTNMITGADGKPHYIPPGWTGRLPNDLSVPQDGPSPIDDWEHRDRDFGLRWMDPPPKVRPAVRYPDDVAQMLRLMCHDRPRGDGKQPTCPHF